MIYITKEAILVHEESIAIIILWALIFVYSILGSIDFGAGFGAWYTQNINARCQACQPILITDLGSNKYVSRLCRCRISWLLSESSLYSCDSNVRTRYVNFSTRGNSQYIYGICLFSAEVPTPSSYYFRYYRALNSSSINYRFTSYRRCLYYNV